MSAGIHQLRPGEARRHTASTARLVPAIPVRFPPDTSPLRAQRTLADPETEFLELLFGVALEAPRTHGAVGGAE